MPAMSATPLVSVVLTTHDRPGWLASALTSVVDGTFRDIEAIVSNNGDPAHTRRLSSLNHDPRVRWVEQPSSTSVIEHLRAALGLACGKYVAVLHDDDRWSPDFLAALTPPLEEYPEAVVSFADHYIVNARGEVSMERTEATSVLSGRRELAPGLHQPFFDLLPRQTIPFLACVFRRDALPPAALPDDVGTSYDIWNSYVLASTGGAAYYEPSRLLYYREHLGSVTGSSDLGGCLAAIDCRSRMMRDPRLDPYRGQLAVRLARDHELAGARLLRQGLRRQGRSHLQAAIRLKATPKALAGWSAAWLAPRFVLSRL
jgi:glycosyltransferase involved in cell wall biosynthesis